MKKFLLSLVALFVTMSAMATATEITSFEFKTTNTSDKGGGYTTQTLTYTNPAGESVTTTGFNNNSNSWNFIKCGGSKQAAIAKIQTNFAVKAKISGITLKLNAAPTEITKLNSVYVSYADEATGTWTQAASIPGSSLNGATEINFTINDAPDSKFWRVSFDCKQTKNNGIVIVENIKFF